MVYWALNFVTIIAGGFAMETVISLLGPQWLPVFLVLWLISKYPLIALHGHR